MGLYEEIEKIDEQIAERDGKNPEAVAETPVDTVNQPEVVETVDKAEPVDTKKAEVVDTPAEDPPTKPTDADFARMRRDKAAAEKRAEDAERRAAQPPAPAVATAPTPAADAEPDKATNYEGWLEWRSRKVEAVAEQAAKDVADVKQWKDQTVAERQADENKKAAFGYLENKEREFAKTAPDYNDVRQFALDNIARSLRTLYPSLEGAALGKAVEKQVLVLAANAERQGYDPIEHMYHQAKAAGYTPKAPPVAEQPAETPPAKPLLKNIAANKQKSASPLAAGGKNGAAPMSRDAIKGMKFSDVASLSPEQFRIWENASKHLEGA